MTTRVLLLLAALAMGCGAPAGGAVDVADGPGSAGAAADSAVDPTAIRPFDINVPDDVLEDLKTRLARTRLPDQIENSGWEYGTPVGYLTELITYWRDEFDWREQERRLNEFDQFKTRIDATWTSTSFTSGRPKRTRCRSSSRTAGRARSPSSRRSSAP